MHAFFMMRGNKRDHDEVVKFLETRGMTMPVTMPDGKVVQLPVSSMLQPITLWSLVFPENCKDQVLTSLNFDSKPEGAADPNGSLWKERISKAKIGLMAETLRLALGAKKVPEFNKDKGIMFLPKSIENVQIIPIGVKYDKLDWKDPNGTIHEAI